MSQAAARKAKEQVRRTTNFLQRATARGVIEQVTTKSGKVKGDRASRTHGPPFTVISLRGAKPRHSRASCFDL